MSTAYKLAKAYYPRLWSAERLEALVQGELLTREEADEIMREAANE